MDTILIKLILSNIVEINIKHNISEFSINKMITFKMCLNIVDN